MDLSSACAVNASLAAYLDSLTTGFFDSLERRDEIIANLEGEQAQESSLLIGGTIMYFAALVFGPAWLRHILMAVGAVVGACTTRHALAASQVLAIVPLHGDGLCVAEVVLVIGSGLLAAVLIIQSLMLGYFALGAAGGGLAAQLAVQAAGLATTKGAPFAILAAAVTGGLFFMRVADALIDMAVGVLGSYLIAQGAIRLLLNHQQALGVSLPHVDEYRVAYLFVLTGGLFIVRHVLLVRARGHGRVNLQGANEPLIYK